MSSISMNSNAESSSLSVPKLHDNGSNWADYEPRLRKAMGSKGLWRHVDGCYNSSFTCVKHTLFLSYFVAT